jgi:hypothetical protein
MAEWMTKRVIGIMGSSGASAIGYQTARRWHCFGHVESVEFRQHQEQPVL